jgi:hypothetical protein
MIQRVWRYDRFAARWVATQFFGVRVGFVSCGAVALLALILLPLFGRES